MEERFSEDESRLLKEISTLRIEQLDELENIFDYLEDNRNLKDYQGEKSARNEKIVASCIKFAWTPISLEISIPEERHEEKRRKTKKTNREASFKEPSQSCRLETD
ncbi:UPF0489 protein C5orf22 isoform X3 [Vespula maculifrons]|uniref:UPF0489 protein C5orf22 isoform X3 n=1 Tax=Vespula maculifrons TaxID=7453 RepID=A0ABD2CNI1_VESMC